MLLALLAPLLACDSTATPTATPTAPTSPPAPVRSRLVEAEAGAGPLADQLREHCAAARELGLRPYAELSATWCGPCKALHKALADPAMQQAIAGTYIVDVDVDLFTQELEALGLITPGIPAIFALGPDCRATGARIDGGAWGADTPDQMAPPLAAFFRSTGAGG